MSGLPKNARKVYEGKLLTVYNWDQEQFDGSIKIFERVEKKPCGYVIPVIDDNILLSYQTQPRKSERYRGHIGGGLHENEEPLAGVKREFIEETGMIAESYEFFRHYNPGRTISQSIYYYIARDCKKVQEPNLDKGGEKLEVRIVGFDEYVDMVIRGICGARGLREEIMLMKIDNKLEDFKKHLFG